MVDKAEARDAISKLIYGYAKALDGGDLPAVGAFFEHATIRSDAEQDVVGARAAEEMFRSFTAFFDAEGWSYQRIDDEGLLCDEVAEALADGQVIGWFQGRMEFGPRALGSRSILGDARRPEMQSIINRKVKFREGFKMLILSQARKRRCRDLTATA